MSVSFESKKPCAFCEIAGNRIPAPVVFEDEVSLAFLDRRPLFPGHCLLVPRDHHETLGDIPLSLVGPLFLNARLLAKAVEEGRPEGILLAAAPLPG